MTAQFSILTVCTGNVHRSPLAEALLRTWVGWYLPAPLSGQVTVSSAGTHAAVGMHMGNRARALAQGLGADGSDHRATQITDDMLARADLVLAASSRHRDEVIQRAPAALRKTFTIRQAGRLAAAVAPSSRPLVVRDLVRTVSRLADARGGPADVGEDDIVDPQGKDDAAYLRMVGEEIVPLAHLAAGLLGMSAADRDAYIAAAQDADGVRAQLAEATAR
ncbi:hypothetical protein P0L94_15645 [Microbacter sp. GSS18]|nr:hypothetical protein P0L94_15645 [Microbacter sp. GSS18]